MAKHVAIAVGLVMSGATWSAPAWADSIDGDWCLGANHLTIQGPTIRTPGGSALTGTYERHGFAYVVPQGETGAGSEVTMRLNHEEMMTVVRRSGSTTSEPETWRRCKPTS